MPVRLCTSSKVRLPCAALAVCEYHRNWGIWFCLSFFQSVFHLKVTQQTLACNFSKHRKTGRLSKPCHIFSITPDLDGTMRALEIQDIVFVCNDFVSHLFDLNGYLF